MSEPTYHGVLVYRAKGGCRGRCSCGATVGPVDCADDMQGAIAKHHPLAKWVRRQEPA